MSGKKRIRRKFREAVFKRDGNTCVFCDVKENLDAHHITDRSDMVNGGYVPENGITLCHQHHMDAEEFHISGGSRWKQNMHPDDLYKMIGSSKELAVEKSKYIK